MQQTLLGSVLEVVAMPDQYKIQTVPISEVPHLESVTVANGLEALLLNHERASGGLVDVPDRNGVCFEVNGLATEHKAWIRLENEQCHLVFEGNRGESEWLGKYRSVLDALQALSKKLA